MKRFVDIVVAIVGLLIFSPFLMMVAVAVKMTSSGPVLFRQERVGRYGHTFEIVKFRTMIVQKSCPGCQVTAGGDPRITPVGKFLRHHKLDELPQLLNVLRGEMSFVGPRPEVPEFAELFPLEYAQILKVRPGITHPATLSFRREEEILADISDPRKFYIDQVMPKKLAAYEVQLEQSLAQDIRTIVETIMPQLGEEAFGGAIQDELQKVAGREVSVSSIYVTLVRLEDQGLVESNKTLPHPKRGGKGKRFFNLTPRGWTALEASRDAFTRMWEGVTPA